MKKVMVFLLILAIAAGVFAQESGTFSWSGDVQVGFNVDFIGDTETSGDDPVYRATIDEYNNIWGRFIAAYQKDGLKLGLDFNTVRRDEGRVPTAPDRASVIIWGEYNDEIFGARAALPLFKNGDPNPLANIADELWGYINFLDGDLRVDVSYKGISYEDEIPFSLIKNFRPLSPWFVSELVKDNFRGPNFEMLEKQAGLQLVYTGIEGLRVGAQLPLLNTTGLTGTNFYSLGQPAIYGKPSFVDIFLRNSIWGVKYENYGLGLSFLWKFQSYEGQTKPPVVVVDAMHNYIHFGASYKINDEISVNTDMLMNMLIFKNSDEKLAPAFAWGIHGAYDNGDLGGHLTFKMMNLQSYDGKMTSIVGDPLVFFGLDVWYRVFNPLRAILTLELEKNIGHEDMMPKIKTEEGTFKIAPALVWEAAPGVSLNLGYALVLSLHPDSVNLKDPLKDPLLGKYGRKIYSHDLFLCLVWSF